MTQNIVAENIIESLRKGIPPEHGIELYSVGNEKLLNGIKRHHLENINNMGIIRFVSGSWGSGKTHLFRQLREIAFQNNCLVSTVTLDVSSATLNKFEKVFSAIISQISTPSYYSNIATSEIMPFGVVLQESLFWLSSQNKDITQDVSYNSFSKALDILMSNRGIDIDFKKMVKEYWKTFLPDAPELAAAEQTRGEILQWFTGEGNVIFFRKRFEVGKIVNKENAKLMFKSLAEFVRLSGYKGLIILFDEAEQSYSLMKKSSLKNAHNNLLSLINNIESLPGLFLIYATTPDFYSDPKHGIVMYGALSGRIGKPAKRPPRALDIIWNMDAVKTELDNYQEAAKKIRKVYLMAYPYSEQYLPDEEALNELVSSLYDRHPELATVRFWRLLMTALIMIFDDCYDSEKTYDMNLDVEELYESTIEILQGES